MNTADWLAEYRANTPHGQLIQESRLAEYFRQAASAQPGWAVIAQLAAQIAGNDPTGAVTRAGMQRLADALGIRTVAQANALAAALEHAATDAVDQLTHRLRLNTHAWPEVSREEIWRIITAKFDMELGLKERRPRYLVWRDAIKRMPTLTDLARIVASCPARHLKPQGDGLDCDDYTDAAAGWNATNGHGIATIGRVEIMTMDGQRPTGHHELRLAIADGEAWLWEPQDNQLYGPDYVPRTLTGDRNQLFTLEI